ncbi:hypothetical protein Vafri_9239 [Volvox africanus]|uniref:Uncharacterized protein n=1 Tax=Volvox africanus TaxID=51714 RepID=A0A8J4F198_9CHLO|nr:hypothetical protein Vafri_9239 [Volvox africanus]
MHHANCFFHHGVAFATSIHSTPLHSTPQVIFVQIFAIGGRQLPLSTTPQLVVLGLLALATLSPASLQTALLAPAGPQLITALVRALAASSDDRFRSLTFQTLTEWINITEGDPIVDDDNDDDEGEEEEEEQKGGDMEVTNAGRGGRATTAMAARDALVDALVDAGLAPAIVHVLESSSNAAALRDACALLLAMLAGGVGGGVSSSSRKAVAGSSGRPGGGGHGPTRVQGLTAMEIPPDAHLEGQSRCRARVELLKAGLVPALLSALGRRPSQFCYWVAINLGVTGARLLEMQWLMLVIARMSVLPPPLISTPESSAKCADADAETTQQAASDPSPAAASGAADSSEVAIIAAVAASSGKGGHPTQPGARAQRGRTQRTGVEDPVKAAAAAERLRLAAVDLLLQSNMLSSLSVESARSIPAASSAGRGSTQQTPPPAAAEAEMEAATRTETGAGGAGVDAAAAAAAETTATPPAVAASTTTLSADAQAVKLLSRAIAASTLCSCVLPDGIPLELLPPRERNATPDFRALQRDRIRKATEEARAAQALASANTAVDVLSKAVASL